MKTVAIAIFVGIALGLAVGWLAVQVRRLIDDTEVELALRDIGRELDLEELRTR